MKQHVEPSYKPRWLNKQQEHDASYLWRMSRAYACSHYDRLFWTTKELRKIHPTLTFGGAYKDISAMFFDVGRW